MKAEDIIKKNLTYGDRITLYTWSYLMKKCEAELDFGKPNGNLVCPNGYRLFDKEKEMYGQTYKVKSVTTSEFYPDHVIVNCMGKGEISPFEIKSITKFEDIPPEEK